MALDSYDGLLASIKSWLYNRNQVAAVAPDFVSLCEAQMNAVVRHRLMATTASITLAGELTDLPADFRGEISLTGQRVMTPVSLEQMAQDKLWITSGCDQRYAILGDQLQVWPAPTAGDTATLVYMQAIPALAEAAPSQSNWLLARWPNAYLFGSLLQAAPFLDGDERIPIWQGLFEAALASIEKSNRQEMGRSPRVRAGMPTP